MEDTLKTKSDRDIFYYRQRMKNRVFAKLVQFFAEEAERTGITKKDISKILRKDPAQITRWLSAPTNLTLDTISDLLLALDAEIDISVIRFSDREKRNDADHFEKTAGSIIPVESDRVAKLDSLLAADAELKSQKTNGGNP
jgi:transcriptional regulator with XRE-family HTH domain